jgi:large subunit ribosomal protein L5
MARLRTKYYQEIVPAMMKEFSYTNIMQVPRLEKIVVNMGLGEAVQNSKVLEAATQEISQITGQKPIITRARRSIAGFKIRTGMAIGAKVTLRREKMYEFLDRLVNVALPRVRDFRGVSGKSFDGRGNYTLGIAEQIIFPEIDYDAVDKVRGLSITIATTARTDEEARTLLTKFGMPYRS